VSSLQLTFGAKGCRLSHFDDLPGADPPWPDRPVAGCRVPGHSGSGTAVAEPGKSALTSTNVSAAPAEGDVLGADSGMCLWRQGHAAGNSLRRRSATRCGDSPCLSS